MPSVSPDSMFLPQLNSIEPPWYGPVCPVVWEGWHREVSPYPDQTVASYGAVTGFRHGGAMVVWLSIAVPLDRS
jgi:hypothetical protein